jgi:magnesium transporter
VYDGSSGFRIPLVESREAGGVIVDCALYADGCRRPGPLPLEQAADVARADPGAFAWIGLYEPTPEEFEAVAAEFALHPLAVEDAIQAHQRPKLEIYGEGIFLVLKTATYLDHEEVVELGELMVFVGADFVVTVRHGAHNPLTGLRARLEGDPERLTAGPSAVMHALVDHVVDHYEEVLHDLDRDIDEITEQVFSGDGRDHAQRIFLLKREILEFTRAVHPLVEPLERVALGKVVGIDPGLAHWFRDVHDHLLKVDDHLRGHSSLLDGALNANLTQVGMQQNSDMRKISAWAAIAAVPTAVAGIYGMNFEHMPELAWRFGYPAVLGLLLVSCVWLYRNFKRRDWL